MLFDEKATVGVIMGVLMGVIMGVINVGLGSVLLFCRSELIHYNAGSPSVRRAMFIDFIGAQIRPPSGGPCL